MGCCARCIVVPRCLDFRTTFLQGSSVGGHLTAGDFLPSDIWAIVFSHLSTNELKESSMRVCKDWKQIGEIVMKERFTFQPTEKQAWVLDEGKAYNRMYFPTEGATQAASKTAKTVCLAISSRPMGLKVIHLQIGAWAMYWPGSALQLNPDDGPFTRRLIHAVHECKQLVILRMQMCYSSRHRDRAFAFGTETLPVSLEVFDSDMHIDPRIKDDNSELRVLCFNVRRARSVSHSDFQRDSKMQLQLVDRLALCKTLEALSLQDVLLSELGNFPVLMELRYLAIREYKVYNLKRRGISQSLFLLPRLEILSLTLEAIPEELKLFKDHPSLKGVFVESEHCHCRGLRDVLTLPQLISLSILSLDVRSEDDVEVAIPPPGIENSFLQYLSIESHAGFFSCKPAGNSFLREPKVGCRLKLSEMARAPMLRQLRVESHSTSIHLSLSGPVHFVGRGPFVCLHLHEGFSRDEKRHLKASGFKVSLGATRHLPSDDAKKPILAILNPKQERKTGFTPGPPLPYILGQGKDINASSGHNLYMLRRQQRVADNGQFNV